ncbi:hypothetical protein MFLAVUS_007787 [Mucor flavus]|uniref:non-specific serine/threonine protein kinase n=1 Tax=Mucor flavus TaxID=439312 RepID=A0ABP9Z597_9FUNG
MLASAGFYFSPVTAYCGVSITVNPRDTDLVNKHRNSSTDRAFFEETHNTRSSIKGNESKNDSSSRKRAINNVSTSSETVTCFSKRLSDQGKITEAVYTKRVLLLKNPAASNKTKGVQKAATKINNSIWNFKQILNLPKPTHRTTTTYGSSQPVHHLPRNARNNPSSINILPGFKSSLLIKTNAVDVWSVGVILARFMTGTYPFFVASEDSDAIMKLAQADIIHRDIKPNNFLYSRRKKMGFVIDLGLAEHVDEGRILEELDARIEARY